MRTEQTENGENSVRAKDEGAVLNVASVGMSDELTLTLTPLF